jgi:hypothetical protein
MELPYESSKESVELASETASFSVSIRGDLKQQLVISGTSIQVRYAYKGLDAVVLLYQETKDFLETVQMLMNTLKKCEGRDMSNMDFCVEQYGLICPEDERPSPKNWSENVFEKLPPVIVAREITAVSCPCELPPEWLHALKVKKVFRLPIGDVMAICPVYLHATLKWMALTHPEVFGEERGGEKRGKEITGKKCLIQ